jgi:hypothetical protein
MAPDQTLMSVPVTGSAATFKAGTPKSLFKMPIQSGPGTPFDVSPDGQRFIVNVTVPSRLPPYLNVVVNWPALLSKQTIASGDPRNFPLARPVSPSIALEREVVSKR